jgi:hypothetical protein
MSGIHGFAGSALDLLWLTSLFKPSCWHLLETYQQAQATQVHHKYQMKREIETRNLFYRSSDSVESYSPLRGLWATQQRSALEDHEGHSSRSLFHLLFLLLVDTFPCGSGIKMLQTSQGTPQSIGCSLATPSRLGPKSPRVTKCKSRDWQICKSVQGWLALNFESHSTYKIDFAIWINHSLREVWRVFSRLRNMYGSQQN